VRGPVTNCSGEVSIYINLSIKIKMAKKKLDASRISPNENNFIANLNNLNEFSKTESEESFVNNF